MAQHNRPNKFLQFSVRSILAVMVALSIGLAVFVPFVRAQPPALARVLVWSAITCAALVVAGWVVLCFRRWRIETRGGTLLLRPQRPNIWLEYLPNILMIVAFAVVLIVGCLGSLKTLKSISGGLQGSDPLPLGLMVSTSVFTIPMLALVYVITLSWWRVTPLTLELREHGICVGGLKFHPWIAITSYEWLDGKHAAMLTIRCSKRKSVVTIPHDKRESVQEILTAKAINS